MTDGKGLIMEIERQRNEAQRILEGAEDERLVEEMRLMLKILDRTRKNVELSFGLRK